jgi:thymidylate kinase
VCDRYIDSTRAYQRELLQQTDYVADSSDVDAFIEPMLSRFIQPNAVIYLDVPADVALDRIDADDSYERRELLESVRSNYISMVDERSEVKRVDAQRSKPDVCKGVSNLIELFEADLYDR